MKNQFLFFFLSLVLLTVTTSCKKDSDDPVGCSAAWAVELTDELQSLQNAAVSYGTNPTTATCNTYKSAVQDYIDALEPYSSCDALTGQNKADFEQALDEARDSLVGD
jgi:hypothetical protein